MGTKDKHNLLYATLLGTIAGSLERETASWATSYAGQTAAFGNFDHFRPSATDLYVLLYSLGPKGPDKSKMIHMLRSITRGTLNKSEAQSVLLRLERSLSGLDQRLRTARRAVVNWEATGNTAKKQAAQNIILVTNGITRRAEVLPYMKIIKGGPRGFFGKSSTLKKAAAVAGAGLAGFWLGKKMYDPTKSFSWGRKREAIELDTGNMLAEDRATQLSYIAQKLPEHPAVEKLISVNYIADGISAFVRTKDGNAYEFEIRPARFAKGHEDKRGVTEEWEYKVVEIEEDNDKPLNQWGEEWDADNVCDCAVCGEPVDFNYVDDCTNCDGIDRTAYHRGPGSGQTR